MEANPTIEVEILHHVVQALRDGDKDARRSSVEAIGNLVEARPKIAAEALRHFVHALQDEE